MGLIFRLAWRNLWRNWRRSIITASAIAVGVASLIFFWALVDGAHEQVIKLSTDMLPGEIQIHLKGFSKNPSLEKLISQVDLIEKVLSSNAKVKAFSPRVKAYALASSADDSAGVIVYGIDPAREKQVTYFYSKVISGSYLSQDDEMGALLGKTLAENLNVQVGDKVVLLAQAADGSLGAESFRVRGIIDFNVTELNSATVIAHIKGISNMLYIKGVHEYAVKIQNVRHCDEVKVSLERELGEKYEVLTWKEIMPFLYQGIEMDNATMYLIVIIVTIIAGFGVMNTILMSVTERTREFGIMHAMGADVGVIAGSVVLESVMLNIVGVIMGMLLGAGISTYFHVVGIDLSRFSDIMEMFALPKVLYPYFTADSIWHVGLSIAMIFVIAVLASLYPAYKVAKLQPVEAMRYL